MRPSGASFPCGSERIDEWGHFLVSALPRWTRPMWVTARSSGIAGLTWTIPERESAAT